MSKVPIGVNVHQAAITRIKIAFNNFEKVCVSFSGGKDSTVLMHLVMKEAIKRKRKVGVLYIDFEAQYKHTITNVENLYEMYKDHIDFYWVSLPIHLRNAVSVYEPFWKCWDPEAKESWVRDMPANCIKDCNYFPFFHDGMEFEEFVPLFAEWYADGTPTAFFVGIRADESYSRHLTIASRHKSMFLNQRFTTKVTKSSDSYNFYPVYDWRTADIWKYQAENPELPYNRIYDLMYQAGLPQGHMRLCQPYGDDQKRGLWLFHILEPETWGRIIARVNGANSGAMYAKEHGNINGHRAIACPEGMTWKQFAYSLIKSMPPKTRVHYANKIGIHIKWWVDRGYPDSIPDESDYDLEIQKKAPSWRRICKSLLRNDYWCKGLGFTQTKSAAYQKYLDLMKRRRDEEFLL